MTDPNRYADLSDEQLWAIHAACERFEQALRRSEVIRLEDLLAAAADEVRAPLFQELLAIEFERLSPSERPARRAEYRDRFPGYTSDIEQVFQESATEPPGSVAHAVPGYEFEGVLGRGGMGVVYQARHRQLNRPVALKMILAGGHAGPDERARFRIEAESVARLQHPNIVQIHEVGEADGHPFCALEFVAGGNLADKLDGRPMSARAMQLAHSRNIVHRDLKPANILLQKDEG